MESKIVKYSTIKAQKLPDRVLRFVGSDNKVDRDGDVVESWNLTEYKKNPVVLFGHNYSGAPVAKTKRVWVDKQKNQLMFDIEFPEPEVSAVGDSLYKLYANGFMNATSIGFIPDRTQIKYAQKKGDPIRRMANVSVLEISLVSVPANPRALLSQKSIEEAKRLDIIDDLELNQIAQYLDETEEAKAVEEVIEPVEEDTEQKTVDYEAKIAELSAEIEELKTKTKNYVYELYDDFIETKNTENEMYERLLRELKK